MTTVVIDRPLWIVGPQRSGSTIFARCIANHEDVCLTVHGKLLYYILHWCDHLNADPSHFRLDEMVHSLRRMPVEGVVSNHEEWVTLVDRVGRSIIYNESIDLVNRMKMFWSSVYYELSPSATVYGDKYNEYVLYLNAIESLFPDSRYIFVHRDPVDTCKSMLRSFSDRPWSPNTMATALVKWSRWVQAWINFRAKIPQERYLEVRFEEMIENPIGVFSQATQFLQICCTQVLLQACRDQVRTPEAFERSENLRWSGMSDEAEDVLQKTAVALGYRIRNSR